MIRGGTMAIQKKSLISALKTAKKANVASAKPVGEDVTAEVVNPKNLSSMRKNLRRATAKKTMRSLKSAR
jgi:hypothetical protein